MAINLTAKALKDNTIIVKNSTGEISFEVSDEIAEQIIALATNKQISKKQVSEPVTTKVEAPADIRAEYSDVRCKWGLEEVKTPDGRKFYRIIDGIFTAGKWMQSKFNPDEEYRIPVNQEAHRIATNKVKALQGVKAVEMVKDGWKAYGFTSKKKAEEALKKLPTHIQKCEIAEYVAEHGCIKAKAFKRKKVG